MKQDLYIKAQPAASEAPVGATLMKTGQTTSYRTGDDGDLEEGRDVDFFTLPSNNPFGNTNRFTDELGGQTYTNNIVIDWSTYNGATVLGYRRTDNGVNINWNDSIDGALSVSIGTFTNGWRLPNVLEFFSLLRFSTTAPLNYPPFNLTIAYAYWTSTTNGQATNNAVEVFNTQNATVQGLSNKISTVSSRRYIPCRTFTVTGTTLT